MVPILGSQLLLFVGFIFFAVLWQKRNVEIAQRNAVERVFGNFEIILQERERLLRAAVHGLQSDSKIGLAFSSGDRNRLLGLFAPYFNQAHDDLGLDMFYFIQPEGEILARLHDPSRFGDWATNPIFLRSRENQSIGSLPWFFPLGACSLCL